MGTKHVPQRPIWKRVNMSLRSVLNAWWVLGLVFLFSSRLCRAQSFQDFFTNRETITATGGTLNGSNTNATIEPGEPRHGGKPGGHSLWISFLAPTNGVVRFTTEAPGFDSLLSAYYFRSTNDTTLDKLAEAARDDDSEELGTRESRIEFGITAGRRYEIAVDGYFGAVGDFRLRWSLDATPVAPPTVLSTPPDQTLQLGASVTLTVVLTNVPNGTKFKWYRNDTELPDEKNTVLVIPSLQVTNVGHYKLLIDVGQKITFFTIPADLQINTEGANALAQSKFPDASGTGLVGRDGSGSPSPLPTVRTVAHLPKGLGPVGVVRGYNGSQIFDTTYATTDPAEPAHCGVPPGASYWLMYQPPTNGTLSLDTGGSSYETALEVYTYDGTPQGYRDLISIACDHGITGNASHVQPGVIKLRQYLIAISGVAGARGVAHLNYSLNTNQLPQPPSLLSEPVPKVVTNGSDVALGVQVAGASPMKFLWRKDGALLADFQAAVLRLPRANITNSGSYVLAITNDLGGLEARLSLRVLFPARCELSLMESAAVLRFATVPGQKYTIEHALEITGSWAAASAPWIGDGATVTTNFPAALTGFYRLRIE